ncbi:uncharacterized protein LOC113514027 isoform X2 [Galleria mellonella]|uniref:Uncharacterized protein LOC113514027 isoform X2 n=1 Tax=Galleria mellonella TaxID=7137 RepID=A0ABM3MS72_GALME|nr:uncharacterized protein LOC113514027 isoform X2 [Galleria mellonella]
MKLIIIFAIALCAYATEVEKKKEAAPAEVADNKDKRQTQQEYVPGALYRVPRKQKAAPVQEPQEDDRNGRSDAEEYRPGQVISLNPQELLELQPERKAPLSSNQLLQQLYSPQQQQEQKPGPQQIYYLEPQTARQVAYQPSHAVIARPHYSSNGGEASVGAALSVSDSGTSSSDFDQELLALLSHSQGRTEEPRQQYQTQVQQASTQSVAPQYQQVDRYITKPSKKPSKLRPKVTPPQPLPAGAPQQYLIETTNVQQQQPQQSQVQYRPVHHQPQRPVQSLRYVPIQPAQAAVQQVVYERPESQGLKVVPAPKLVQEPVQQQVAYRFIPQYQQPEATPKQYRIIDVPRPQVIRPDQRPPSSAERPVTYLKRYPEPEKNRAVKIYDPASVELAAERQSPQAVGQQYYLRPVYRTNEQNIRYESVVPATSAEQPRAPLPTKTPHSAIYVSKNLSSKKPRPLHLRPDEAVSSEQPRTEHISRLEQVVRIEQAARAQQSARAEQAARTQLAMRAQQIAHTEQTARAQQAAEQVGIEQYSQNIDDQRAQLPPPKNNKAYTPEEFAALVAAGYAVTPIPVSTLNAQQAQSRSSEEIQIPQLKHRPIYRRPQYLPIRGDDAP